MMAITESMPVGSDVAAAMVGKAATVDGTAFAALMATAGKAAGSGVAGKGAAPVGPVKGQQDLVGWDSGRGEEGQDDSETLAGIGAGLSSGAAGVGDPRGTVSSLIGKQEIVENEEVPAKGQAVTTVVESPQTSSLAHVALQTDVLGTAQGKSLIDEVVTAAKATPSPTEIPTAKNVDQVVEAVTQQVIPGKPDVTQAQAVPVTVALDRQAPEKTGATTVGLSGISSESSRDSGAQVLAGLDAKRPEVDPTPAGLVAPEKASVRPALVKTATVESQKVPQGEGIHTGEKTVPVGAAVRKPPVAAEATPKPTDVVGVEFSVGAGVAAEPVANVVAPGSPAVEPPLAASDAKTGSPVVAAQIGSTVQPDVSPALSERLGAASRVGEHRAAAATTAKRGREAGLKLEDGSGQKAVAETLAPTGTGDGSSVLPIAVAAETTVLPAFVGGAAVTTAEVLSVPGTGAPSAVGLKVQGTPAGLKDKDGKNALSSVQREAVDTRAAHVAAGEPVVSGITTTAPAAAKSGAEHGPTHEAVAAATQLATTSTAHLATAVGSGGVGAPVAPSRFEGTTTVASAMGGARAEVSELTSGLSSGLAGSGQSHTTLQATPTVLEVGVPGGTHGWLKIRAEIGEGGAVQASVSSATEAGQDTLRKELPAMSAYLQSEHVPVSLQMAHGVATVAGGDGLAAGLGFGSGAGGQTGANPEQSRNDAASSAGVATAGTDAGELGSGRQQSFNDSAGSGAVAAGSADGVSAAVSGSDTDWITPLGYGGISLTTGGSWVNVIA